MVVQRSRLQRAGAFPRARVVNGLEAVDPVAWNRLVPPGSGGLNHAFLRAWERCELPALSSRPLVIMAPDDDRLLAAAASYVYDLDLASVHQLRPRRLLAAARRALPRFMIARVLELGAPVAAVRPLLLAEGTSPRDAADAIIDAALADADAAGASFVIVQDCIAADEPLGGTLRARGFARLRTLPTAVLEHDYGSFEDYLAGLRSKYRSRARRALRKSQHLRLERVADFSEQAGEFAGLWRLVYERATETKREVLAKPFFEAAAGLPDTEALLLRRPDGSIAAFGLLLADTPCLHFLQCGFAVDAGRNEAAYFRLLLEVVRCGIDDGFRRIHLGCTALGPKLDLGGVAMPLTAWIRHRNPVVNAGCAIVARLSEREPTPAPRPVFAGRE